MVCVQSHMTVHHARICKADMTFPRCMLIFLYNLNREGNKQILIRIKGKEQKTSMNVSLLIQSKIVYLVKKKKKKKLIQSKKFSKNPAGFCCLEQEVIPLKRHNEQLPWILDLAIRSQFKGDPLLLIIVKSPITPLNDK